MQVASQLLLFAFMWYMMKAVLVGEEPEQNPKPAPPTGPAASPRASTPGAAGRASASPTARSAGNPRAPGAPGVPGATHGVTRPRSAFAELAAVHAPHIQPFEVRFYSLTDFLCRGSSETYLLRRGSFGCGTS